MAVHNTADDRVSPKGKAIVGALVVFSLLLPSLGNSSNASLLGALGYALRVLIAIGYLILQKVSSIPVSRD